MISSSVQSIDEYLLGFSGNTLLLLNQMRHTIQMAVPEASEKISYGIPTFYLHGNLVHFAGYKNHIGFYPGAGGIKAFEKELQSYACSKGTVQFPLDKKLPVALIKKIVKFRVQQNMEKQKKATRSK